MALDVNDVGGVDIDDGEPMLPKGTEALRERWHPISPEWLDPGAKPPPREYLLRCRDDGAGAKAPGFLPSGRVGMLVAEGAGGKSWAAIELALSVASGVPWFGTYTVEKPGRVLLALGEEEASEIHRRLWNAALAMELTPEQRQAAARRIVALPLAGVPVRLTNSATREDPDGSEESPNAKALWQLLHDDGEPWALLVFDPISRFAGGDAETDNAAATRFIQALEHFTKAKGNPTVLAAHHTNKVARESGKPSAAAARGSSAFTDGARWVAQLSPHPHAQTAKESMGLALIELAVTKSNYGWSPSPLALKRAKDFEGALLPLSQDEAEALQYLIDNPGSESKAKKGKAARSSFDDA